MLLQHFLAALAAGTQKALRALTVIAISAQAQRRALTA